MAFSATAAATEGFRVIGGKPAAVAIWILAVAIYLTVFGGLFFLLFADDFAAIEAMSKTTVEPSMLPAFFAQIGAMVGVGMLIYLVGMVVLYAAIMRAALGGERAVFGYLRLGMDEVRLGLASLIVLTAFYIAIAAVAGAIIAVAYSDAGIALKVGFGLLLGAAALGLVIWAAIRICLLWPMILAEKRVDFGRAWRLTKGRFWPVLGMVLLVMVISWVVQIVWETIFRVTLLMMGADVFGNMQNPSDVEAIVGGNTIVFAALGVVFVAYLVLYVVLTVAPYARAYRDIAGDPKGQAEVFR